MTEAKLNDTCIIGLPTCGYAFSSSRMAFIATPADQEFSLELEILQNLLKEKQYEAYIALNQVDPAKLAFCTKICSKIISSQFCVVILNHSSHREHPEIKIPNPNVHMEYGLMMAFKKYVIPFQQDGDSLAFNIRPLDTIIYTKGNFKDLANKVIDEAIIKAGTTNRPTRAITSNEHLLKYISVRGLRVTELNTDEASYLYNLGKPMGYYLLNGKEIVYLGLFDLEPAKEVVFRLKLLLQCLSQAKVEFDTITSKSMTPEQIEKATRIWNMLRVEVIISMDLEKNRIEKKVKELTKDFSSIQWKLLNDNDIRTIIDKEYTSIGEI
ncbi:MAG: hypothetical protein GY777_02065 [Candidatus Brocadiaceae bacterium]|nr:hypothetical protein [Candidatus Brocadiaceae bacterium]